MRTGLLCPAIPDGRTGERVRPDGRPHHVTSCHSATLWPIDTKFSNNTEQARAVQRRVLGPRRRAIATRKVFPHLPPDFTNPGPYSPNPNAESDHR